MNQHVIHGLRDGFPIAMGYLAVAFSLGIIAAKAGLTASEGFLSSFLPEHQLANMAHILWWQ